MSRKVLGLKLDGLSSSLLSCWTRPGELDMDPISASVVVGLLAKFAAHLAGLAGTCLDEAVKERLAKLWEVVRSRFARDPHAAITLQRVAEQPDNELRQAALQDYLAEAMQADREFCMELTRIAQPVVSTTVTADISNSGAVAAGGTVNIRGRIAAGRDVLGPLSSKRNDEP